MGNRSRISVIVCFAAILIVPTLCFAALGDNVNSVSTDQARLRASARIAQRQGYSMTELQSPNGTAVREFVSPAGTVYGVAWQGPALPDLRQVLGKYFDQYVSLMKSRRARGPSLMRTGTLVIQVSGHQRAMAGRVYLPQSVPSGTNPEDIR